jgi:hypothetical protein
MDIRIGRSNPWMAEYTEYRSDLASVLSLRGISP